MRHGAERRRKQTCGDQKKAAGERGPVSRIEAEDAPDPEAAERPVALDRRRDDDAREQEEENNAGLAQIERCSGSKAWLKRLHAMLQGDQQRRQTA